MTVNIGGALREVLAASFWDDDFETANFVSDGWQLTDANREGNCLLTRDTAYSGLQSLKIVNNPDRSGGNGNCMIAKDYPRTSELYTRYYFRTDSPTPCPSHSLKINGIALKRTKKPTERSKCG